MASHNLACSLRTVNIKVVVYESLLWTVRIVCLGVCIAPITQVCKVLEDLISVFQLSAILNLATRIIMNHQVASRSSNWAF